MIASENPFMFFTTKSYSFTFICTATSRRVFHIITYLYVIPLDNFFFFLKQCHCQVILTLLSVTGQSHRQPVYGPGLFILSSVFAKCREDWINNIQRAELKPIIKNNEKCPQLHFSHLWRRSLSLPFLLWPTFQPVSIRPTLSSFRLCNML